MAGEVEKLHYSHSDPALVSIFSILKQGLEKNLFFDLVEKLYSSSEVEKLQHSHPERSEGSV